jgi:hypothetical protein
LNFVVRASCSLELYKLNAQQLTINLPKSKPTKILAKLVKLTTDKLWGSRVMELILFALEMALLSIQDHLM